jgi:putative membrane protein
VSLFERRVEILADQGIHSQVAPGFWDEEVNQIVKAIHDDQFVPGLCKVIAEIGNKLSVSFPRKEDDINELPNAPQGGL